MLRVSWWTAKGLNHTYIRIHSDVDHFLKVFIEFVTLLFQFFFGHEAGGILAPHQGSNLHSSTLEGEEVLDGQGSPKVLCI